MQCPACQFENLPGLTECARCGSSLVLDTVSVEPPRAGRLHLATNVSRVRGRMGLAVASIAAPISPMTNRVLSWLRVQIPAPVSGRALAWSLLPGFGQLMCGRRRLGQILLGVWCLCVLLAMIFVSPGWSWFFLGLAVSAHATGILAVFATQLVFERILSRLLFGLVIYVVLMLVVYVPTTDLLATTIARPVQLNDIISTPALQRGDVILLTGSLFHDNQYKRGDVVAYLIPNVGGNGVVVNAGLSVDRIIGVPGDTVVINADAILVNGTPLPANQLPLGGRLYRADLTWQLGPDEYCILPSLLALHINPTARGASNMARDLLRDVGCVRLNEIQAPAWIRVRPWSRFGRLE